MKNFYDLIGNIHNSDVLQPKRKSCSHEILRFVLPPTEHHEYIFGGSRERIIKMEYCYYPDYPEYIGLIEVNVVPPADLFKFAYILIANDYELLVARCYSIDDSKNPATYNNNYPYIILPQNYDELTEWTYDFSDEIHVHCTSWLLSENIGENKCDILYILRDITTRNKSMTSVESYMAGFGLQEINTEIDE